VVFCAGYHQCFAWPGRLRKKQKLNKLVSAANQLKLTAAGGKEYRTDTFDYDGIIALAKNFPKSDRIIVEVESKLLYRY